MVIITKNFGYGFFALVLSLCLLFSTAAPAQKELLLDTHALIHPEKPFENELKLTHTGTVTQVIDPLRIEIDHKKIVQLVNIDIPDYDPYDPGPLAVTVKATIEDMLKGKKVKFYQRKKTKETGFKTRMEHLLGHVVRAQDGLWLQGHLLAGGYARIRPSQYNTEAATSMKALENHAEEQKIGLWDAQQYPQYRKLSADNADDGMNGWGVIEGKITKVSTMNNAIYLNFGNDWRKDFTIMLESDVRRAFAKDGINPMSLTGKRIQVRGWLEEYNGPMIKLLNPVWLDLIDSQSLPE